jgi:hypothetical protein
MDVESAPPPSAPLRLPRVDEECVWPETSKLNTPCSTPTVPPSAEPTMEPQDLARLDLAGQFVLDAIRDNAALDLEFLDGGRLRGTPTGVGLHSLRLQADDGSELVVFDHGLRALRRCAPAGVAVSRKRPPARGKARQVGVKLRVGRSAKRS